MFGRVKVLLSMKTLTEPLVGPMEGLVRHWIVDELMKLKEQNSEKIQGTSATCTYH